MSIYTYDSNTVGEQLTPPILRKAKFLAFLYVLVKPIQNLWELVFAEYITGVGTHSIYSDAVSYSIGNVVVWNNGYVYECIKTPLVAGTKPSDTIYWLLRNTNFIGSDNRVKYNSQIIKLEYQLNKWYQNLASATQIYIENNTAISMQFVMGNDGANSSVMPNDSIYQEQYMGNDPTYPDVSFDFTILVPTALYTTLGTTASNREYNVRAFVNQYVLSGIKYKINTY